MREEVLGAACGKVARPCACVGPGACQWTGESDSRLGIYSILSYIIVSGSVVIHVHVLGSW